MKNIEQKRREGEVRTAYWQGLSTAEKLADLDRRLGKDVGAKRQRAKLAKESVSS